MADVTRGDEAQFPVEAEMSGNRPAVEGRSDHVRIGRVCWDEQEPLDSSATRSKWGEHDRLKSEGRSV